MPASVKPAVTDLADSLVAAMPSLDASEQALALAMYRELSLGQAVSADALAARLGEPRSEVEATLDRWPGLYCDERSRIVGFWGLALGEMPHRIRMGQRQLYTWCAWDSLFIPGLVGKPAEVESLSPTSGARIHLTVNPCGVQELTPVEAVVSMLAPTEKFDHNVILSFCHYVHFFTSPRDAEPWLDEHPGTFSLSVDQAFELGRLTNRARFGDTTTAWPPACPVSRTSSGRAQRRAAPRTLDDAEAR